MDELLIAKLNIGCKVIKKSNKPFKSKLKINTIKNITINPYTDEVAYEFNEDNSYVDIRQCSIYGGE